MAAYMVVAAALAACVAAVTLCLHVLALHTSVGAHLWYLNIDWQFAL